MAFAVGGGGGEEVMSEINVTPLVDVMLVLLVVFLVTAPLLTNAVRVNLPQRARTAPTTPEQNKAVSLSIDAEGKVYVDRRPIAADQVEPELRSLRAAHPQLSVSLNADRTVDYGVVARAMTAVDRAGITRLSVLTIAE
jgi:biopolymer transport protein TolR